MDYEDDEPEYNEVHTGTGKMLGLFLGLVIACAIFFGLGYSMGKSAGAAARNGSLVPDAAAATTPADATKPSPAVPADSATPCPQGQDCSAAPAGSDQMTFYKSVEQKNANPQLTPPAAAPADQSAQAAAAPTPKPKSVAPARAVPSVASGFTVQVAAVTRSQDADALVDALHHKQYPAFVTTTGSDKLLHVQVGPFSDVKDAEAMKARLAADGYKPILKK